MSEDLVKEINSQIENNKVLLYMKGTPQFPMCGFSSRVVQALNMLNTNYSYVNILDRQDIRKELPRIANWPTFPQLYINGELMGGCDIVMDLFETGELEVSLRNADSILSEKPAFESVG